ncbi:MAG: dihydroneopterin aldolase [Akkermansiaceae bacterium]|jgi:phosphoglycolate phosphatase|nr:dihydroneopterin aldolase [Akkermansiaceae bacterium]
MFRALIFDWSGTLVDDKGPTLDATNAVLQRFDKEPMGWEEFRSRFRLPYSEFYEEVLPGIPLAELEDHFRAGFRDSEQAVRPLEGTVEFLNWCRENGLRMFVLTSMDAKEFASQVEAFGFGEYFEETYAGVLDKRKVIHEILREHDLVPEETGYVGDMVHDIETALHGGVVPVGVLSGYDDSERLAAAGPRFLLACVKSLHAMMEHNSRVGSVPRRSEDLIEIRKLRISTHIGVPEEERAEAQDLLVTVEMRPDRAFVDLDEDVERTVNYDTVARWIRALAGERPRKLIETFADEIADAVVKEFAVVEATVTIEKFILPDTECVSVRTSRCRPIGVLGNRD